MLSGMERDKMRITERDARRMKGRKYKIIKRELGDKISTTIIGKETDLHIATCDNGTYQDSVYATSVCCEILSPLVTLISPEDETITSNTTLEFICNASDKEGLENISLYIWNSTGDIFYNASADITL